MKYRKKPVVIEAVQLRWDNWSEMCEHAGVGELLNGRPEGTFIDADGRAVDAPVTVEFDNGQAPGFKIGLLIPTLEGVMLGVQDDYIIRGVKGELYPCRPDIFETTYEAVTEPEVAPDHDWTKDIKNPPMGSVGGLFR